MSGRPRRNHSAAFKAKVAIAAIRGDNASVTHYPASFGAGHQPGQRVHLPRPVSESDLVADASDRRTVHLALPSPGRACCTRKALRSGASMCDHADAKEGH